MNHFISLAVAQEMTARYRKEHAALLNPTVRDREVLPLSESFDRVVFERLLAKPGCTQLRVYYGMDADLKIHAILVAADAEDADLLDPDDEEDIADRGVRCPDLCPKPSPLNT